MLQIFITFVDLLHLRALLHWRALQALFKESLKMFKMLYMQAGEKYFSCNKESKINTKINCKKKYTNDTIRKKL